MNKSRWDTRIADMKDRPKQAIGQQTQQRQTPQADQQQKTSILAIIALITAIFIPLIGLILGIISIVRINRNRSLSGKGLALASVIISTIFLLMTILLITPVVYFGVINPTDRGLPEKCTLPSGIACLDAHGTHDEILISIQNAQGFDMEGIQVSIGEYTCTGAIEITNGAKSIYTCPGYYDERVQEDILMQYTNPQTGLTHTKRGELFLRIE